MNMVLSHDAHEQQKPTKLKTRTQLREGADAILRDIAFVLKMTQKVRDEIDVSARCGEPVTA